MNESSLIILGILLPFFGTAFGAGSVFICKQKLKPNTCHLFFGFAAGVMLAALTWSLILPSLELSSSPLPATAGMLVGAGLFLYLDATLERVAAHFSKKKMGRTGLLAISVTLHNLPEGMAVGVVLAEALSGRTTFAAALVLSLGIALQNVPEGAIISLPLDAVGFPRKKAFVLGTLSGAVEPIGALLAFFLTGLVSPTLPFVLSFAAGTMFYVIIKELIPALSEGEGPKGGAYFSVVIGFCLMMVLDVVLG